VCPLSLPHGDERWLVVRTAQGEQRAAASMEQVVLKEQEHWTKALWHLSNQAFALSVRSFSTVIVTTQVRSARW